MLNMTRFGVFFGEALAGLALISTVFLGSCAATPKPEVAAIRFADAPIPPYAYPYNDPYLATVLGTPPQRQVSLTTVMPTEHDTRVFAERTEGRGPQQVPQGFWYQEKLRWSDMVQNHPAPLVFVIAGTGADNRSTLEVQLGKVLYTAGMHVVLLPSPTNSNFIVAASANHIPGFPQTDAQDLRRVMIAVLNDLKKRKVPITEVDLTGYSLGAWHSAFVAKQDADAAAKQEPSIGINKVLLINPPYSVYNSAVKIDQLLMAGLPNGINGLDAYLDRFLGQLASSSETGDALNLGNTAALGKAIDKNHPDDAKLATAIGTSFRLSAANLVFTSDVMSKSNYIYPRSQYFTTNIPLNDYLAVGLRTSLLNYFNDMYAAYYQHEHPEMTKQDLIDNTSLASIADWLQGQPQIGLLTNADDVILTPGDMEGLKRIFGERADIFPNGGHVGNLGDRTVEAHIAKFFSTNSNRNFSEGEAQ